MSLFKPKSNLYYLYFTESYSGQYYNNENISFECPKFRFCNIAEIQRYYNFASELYETAPKTFLGFWIYQDMIYSKQQ